MKKTSICAALAVAIGFSASATATVAQIREDLATPAELPPSSFSGRQYVDSRGCIYIRAGIDGNVTWVPRVDRDRQVICGQEAAPAAAPARVVEAPAPVVEPAPAPAASPAPAARPAPAATPAPVAARPAPAAPPRRVVQSAAKPQPRVVRRTPEPARLPRMVRPAEPVVQTAPARQVIVRRAGQLPPNTVLRTADGLKKGPTIVVRGTGQTVQVAEAGVKVFVGTSGTTHVTGQTVIAPKRAYERGASVKVPVPQGYERAFDDGRLSTTRAHQTLDGRRKMLLVWTNTVPRRLIDQYTGQEVSHYYPELRYPYRSMREQQAAGFVSSRGEVPKAAPKTVRRSVPQVVRKAAPQTAKAMPTVVRKASHRYVEVGIFTTPAKAQAAIRRLQGAGLPVRTSTVQRSGMRYQTVLVGPFSRQDRLREALDTVQMRVGYRSASLRK
ncbi:SPOR domain-containing protein [Marinovum sp.]|uniref:SPOR domain-containing protein n=1 Tax=Marinovum sp. TaxID=2024839 RepID=UPI002B276C24|nr:SPOR domain-containing protein [Marinovum sp.]